jgi:hypothetical protein
MSFLTMSKLLRLLGELLCQHRQLSWPVCGHYECFECGRVFNVSWSARKDVPNHARAGVIDAPTQLVRTVK